MSRAGGETKEGAYVVKRRREGVEEGRKEGRKEEGRKERRKQGINE